ncbi:MAG: Hint domain-containing protein [Mangrovicoccus sp.]
MPVFATFQSIFTADTGTGGLTDFLSVGDVFQVSGTDVTVQTISLSDADDALAQGDTFSLVLTVLPSGASETVDITLSDSAVYAAQSSDGEGVLYSIDSAAFFMTDDASITSADVLGSDIPLSAADFVCFAEGTLIATPTGEVAVETLNIGDMVLTAEGKAVPVKFLGKTTRVKLFTPAEQLAPVRIAAGALGENLPHTDLDVTVDHALALEGALVHAGALVNGTTIKRVDMAELADTVTYYHVETEEHCLLVANGAAAESYVDNTSRATLDNFAEFAKLYGAEQPKMVEMDMPRAKSFRQVPQRVRDLIAARAAELTAPEALAS